MPRDTSGLRRGGGRQKGVPNKATQEIRDIAARMTDEAWQESAYRRMKAGKAPHLETFFASHRWGKPKDTVAVEGADGAPLVFTLKLNDRDDDPDRDV